MRDLEAAKEELLSALPPGEQDKAQMVGDNGDFEVKRDNRISVKDMSSFLVQGRFGGAPFDLDSRADLPQEPVTEQEPAFRKGWAVPLVDARDGAVYFTPAESRLYCAEPQSSDSDVKSLASQRQPNSREQLVDAGKTKGRITESRHRGQRFCCFMTRSNSNICAPRMKKDERHDNGYW